MLAYILNTGLEIIPLNIEDGQRARFEARNAGAFREFTSEEYNSVGVDNLQYVSTKTVEITGTTPENATIVFTDPFSILSLEDKCRKAEDIIKIHYKSLKEGGITCTIDTVNYNIKYNDNTLTRAVGKSAFMNVRPTPSLLCWTMDKPRTKITFGNVSMLQDFLTDLGEIMETNSSLYLDKIVEINGYTSEEVRAFLSNPSYPAYTNTIL